MKSRTAKIKHDMMRRNIFLVALLTGLIPVSAVAQSKNIQCRWHDESMYDLTLAGYHSEDNIFYLFSNNEDYLYINLVVPGAYEQKKMLLFGMTLWIDPGTKSAKKTGIMYPYRISGRRTRPDGPLPDGADPILEMRKEYGGQNTRGMMLNNFDAVKRDLVKRYRLIGLRNYTDTADMILIPSTNPMEIHGWMNYDSLGYLHETVVIPFDKIPLETDSKSGFNIELETGYFDPQQMMGEQGVRERPGAVQGRPGGIQRSPGGAPGGTTRPGMPDARPGTAGRRMSPGQTRAMMEQRQALSTPTKFKIKKIRLAEKNRTDVP